MTLISVPTGESPKLTIAIIGAAGHVGSAVAQHALDEGHAVVALDRPLHGKLEAQPRYLYQQLDAVDFYAYKRAIRGCDAVIHLAAVYNAHDDEGKLLDDAYQQHVSSVIPAAFSFVEWLTV